MQRKERSTLAGYAKRVRMRPYVTGYRYGRGSAAAVVRPATLVEFWRVLEACVEDDVIIVIQAANTGLTGGSTPRDAGYDRMVVVISTTRIKGVQLLSNGHQAVCLPGSTLHELERALAPWDRAPHSVLGSSCIGASVIGGICNNSGGALVRRGPAFTEMSLYARVDGAGRLELVNTLGIELGTKPEAMLERLERHGYVDTDVVHDPGRAGSALDYEDRVRDISEGSPARFNADPMYLSGASGSAGRVAVFAVRVDSFPTEAEERTFYIGAEDPMVLSSLRHAILKDSSNLPVSVEYIHRQAFDLADLYGKDTFLAVGKLGTQRLPALFAAKAWVDSWVSFVGLGAYQISDRVMQAIAGMLPDHLPPRIRSFRDRYEHHLVLKAADSGIAEIRQVLSELVGTTARFDFFECTDDEAVAAFLHRFAVAGSAVRYRALNRRSVEGVVSIDVALPRNEQDWFERLPTEIEELLVSKVYYGHFLCHVFHQDYLVRKGENLIEIESAVLAGLDARGGRYPAEHNVGHHYAADGNLAEFYCELDPGNRFNPGIGKTPAGRNWSEIS